VIAYIARDIEDAIAVGLIDSFPDTPLGQSNGQVIDSLVVDLLKHSEGKDKIAYGKKTFQALSELYEFNMKNIYQNQLITIHQEKIERLFYMIFDEILKDLKTENANSLVYKDHLLPILDYYPDYLEKTAPEQVVLDYISGMTDRYFINLVNDMFLPGAFPANFSDLSRMTGIPERYLDIVIHKRKQTKWPEG
jgi:dGTPase